MNLRRVFETAKNRNKICGQQLKWNGRFFHTEKNQIKLKNYFSEKHSRMQECMPTSVFYFATWESLSLIFNYFLSVQPFRLVYMAFPKRQRQSTNSKITGIYQRMTEHWAFNVLYVFFHRKVTCSIGIHWKIWKKKMKTSSNRKLRKIVGIYSFQ